MPRDAATTAAIARGGYVLSEAAGAAEVVLIATGSEVSLALAAQKTLAADGIAARVVSMPSTDGVRPAGRRLARCGAAARNTARGRRSRRHRSVAQVRRPRRRVIGLDRFGESAPAGELYKAFGITPTRLPQRAKCLDADPLTMPTMAQRGHKLHCTIPTFC
jgi:transketolase